MPLLCGYIYPKGNVLSHECRKGCKKQNISKACAVSEIHSFKLANKERLFTPKIVSADIILFLFTTA